MLNNARALYQVMHDAKLSRSKLDDLVYRRLREVLVSAYQKVPYYRELMQSVGYNPIQEYSGPEDLSKLPITTKEILKQKGYKAFVKEGADLSGCFRDSTSGSTGIPLTVYRAPYERAVQMAKWLRVLFSVHHKVMSLTSPSRLSVGRSIIQRFGILRRMAIDYLCSPEEMADAFLDYEPDVLYGNRSHLDLMALELKRRGIHYQGLKLLIATAEVIGESSRQLYREYFGIELVESYGSVEMGVMAYETPAHDGLHLCEDLTYFEFLDEEGLPVAPGKPGRVVVTDLMGTLMPFIRYSQGDFVLFEYIDAAIRGVSRVLTQITGREDDHVVLPDGTRRSFHDFYEVMHECSGVGQFRVIQRSRGNFQILVVATNSYFLCIRDEIVRRLQMKFPATVSFEITQVERIAPDPSGKIRMLISEVE